MKNYQNYLMTKSLEEVGNTTDTTEVRTKRPYNRTAPKKVKEEPYKIKYGADLKRQVNDIITDIKEAMTDLEKTSKEYRTYDFVLNVLSKSESIIYICYAVLANKKTKEMVQYFDADYYDIMKVLKPIKSKINDFISKL